MAKVGVAAGAENLRPRHPQRPVRLPRDVVLAARVRGLVRVVEAGPARARVELAAAGEEVRVAADAGEHAAARGLVVEAGPGALGAVAPRDLVLEAGEQLPPVRVGHLLRGLARLGHEAGVGAGLGAGPRLVMRLSGKEAAEAATHQAAPHEVGHTDTGAGQHAAHLQ